MYLKIPQGSNHTKIIQNILTYFWDKYIINVSVLFENKAMEIELYSYFPFTKSSCRQVVPTLINIFSKLYMQWDHLDKFFPPKLKNFHKCSIVAAVWDTPPYVSLYPNKTGLRRIGHFEGVLLKVLSKKLNFTLDLIIPPNDEQRGVIYPNGTTSGAVKLVCK